MLLQWINWIVTCGNIRYVPQILRAVSVSERSTADFVHCSKRPASAAKSGSLLKQSETKSDAIMIRKVANIVNPK
jgi:hypothetical protein